MKAYMKRGVTAPRVPNFRTRLDMSRQFHSLPAAVSGKEPAVPSRRKLSDPQILSEQTAG